MIQGRLWIIFSTKNGDYYATLGVDQKATEDEINEAYQKLASELRKFSFPSDGRLI